MLSDPQSITINSVANSLPRISTALTESIYRTADGNLQLKISHTQSKGRTRRLIRLDTREIVADPITSINDYETLSSYLVIDEPDVGFSDDDVKLFVAGLLAWLTPANVGKVLGAEH